MCGRRQGWTTRMLVPALRYQEVLDEETQVLHCVVTTGALNLCRNETASLRAAIVHLEQQSRAAIRYARMRYAGRGSDAAWFTC